MTPASATSARAFGLLLKRYRRAAHLTQAQLAERAGFSVTYVSKLERGARQPQRATITLLADALDLSAPARIALESAIQASGAVQRQRRGDAARGARLPVGGFLGALPSGALVGRERELTMIEEALA